MSNFKIIKESIQYIESNLYKPFNPLVLCQQYDISEFHYYHLFKHIIGIPLMEYISKRYISDQLYRWASSKKSIPLTEVAHYSMFSSVKNLSKLLKKDFHISLKQYYKDFDGTELYPAFNNHKYKSQCDHVFNIKSEIVTMPSATLIGLSTVTDLTNQRHLKDIWYLKKKIDMQYDYIKHLAPLRCHEVGISYNTSIDAKKYNNISFEYFRGYQVSEFSKLPSDFKVLSLPRQHYIKFLTTTNSEVFEQTLNYIYSDYLINNPIKLKNSNINLIESYRYDQSANQDTIVELYIPIEKS